MLDSAGNIEWQGRAHNAEHAEEKCFYDEAPGSLERFTLQVWGKKKITRSITSEGWRTVYRDACLAPY